MTTAETNAKVDKYVKDNTAFDAASFATVKSTIPAEQQADAERNARAELKA